MTRRNFFLFLVVVFVAMLAIDRSGIVKSRQTPAMPICGADIKPPCILVALPVVKDTPTPTRLLAKFEGGQEVMFTVVGQGDEMQACTGLGKDMNKGQWRVVNSKPVAAALDSSEYFIWVNGPKNKSPNNLLPVKVVMPPFHEMVRTVGAGK